MPGKRTTYLPAPQIPVELMERYQTVVEALAGQLTVSAAARQLGLSRNRFQILLHRGMAALLEAISPQPTGRPSTPAKEGALADENEQLKRENRRLAQRTAMIDRLLGVAGTMLRDRVLETPRERPRRT